MLFANHKSDKQMLTEMIDELSGEEFDLIARDNPMAFLKNAIRGGDEDLRLPMITGAKIFPSFLSIFSLLLNFALINLSE